MPYRFAVFDFDGVMSTIRTTDVVANKFGFREKLQKLRDKWKMGEIREYDISISLAKEFRGKTDVDVYRCFKDISPIRKDAKKVLEKLKDRRIKTCIVTQAFSPIIKPYLQMLKPDYSVYLELEEKDDMFTGKIKNPDLYFNPNCELRHMICKEMVVENMAKISKIKLKEFIAVGDSRGDICMLRRVKREGGLSIGIGSKKEIEPYINKRIKELSEIFNFLK